jgi:aspartate racemase
MKTIGVIGGMGPQATIDFEKRIHQVSNKLITQCINQGYPPMVVFYHRNDPRRTTDSTLYSEKLEPNKGLLEIAKKLGAHADFIVIPTNTAHFFVRQIEEASGLPLLSIVDVTIEKVISLKANTIGVLAIGDTLRHELFQKPLLENHITPVTIPDYLVEKLDKSVWAVMEGTPPEDVKAPVYEAISYLESQSVDAIILGCSEFALMIEHDIQRQNLIDPIQLLAEKAVEYAIN